MRPFDQDVGRVLGSLKARQEAAGAFSSEWFDRRVETVDRGIRRRVLDNNEDNCSATCVVRAGIESLEVANGSIG